MINVVEKYLRQKHIDRLRVVQPIDTHGILGDVCILEQHPTRVVQRLYVRSKEVIEHVCVLPVGEKHVSGIDESFVHLGQCSNDDCHVMRPRNIRQRIEEQLHVSGAQFEVMSQHHVYNLALDRLL